MWLRAELLPTSTAKTINQIKKKILSSLDVSMTYEFLYPVIFTKGKI